MTAKTPGLASEETPRPATTDLRNLPRERTAITGFAGRLAGHSGNLGRDLARWARRAGGPDAEGRRAAGSAMDTIDAMLRELHTLRQALSTEIRASDDAAARRVDELLAKPRPSAPGRTAEDGGDSRPCR